MPWITPPSSVENETRSCPNISPTSRRIAAIALEVGMPGVYYICGSLSLTPERYTMASGSVALLTEAVHAAFAALARARIGTWDCPTREGPLSVLLPPDLRDGCGAATNQDDWSPLGDQRGAILFLSSS